MSESKKLNKPFKFSLPNINDDRGNPLIKNLNVDNGGKKRGRIDGEKIGFTPLDPNEYDTSIQPGPFMWTGLDNPNQASIKNFNKKIPSKTDERISNNKKYSFDYTNIGGTDNINPLSALDPQWNFLHSYDSTDELGTGQVRNRIPNNGENTRDIYLASFLSTRNENEDPTMLGWDLIIDYDTSPLFNGSVENFIDSILEKNTPNSELESRKRVIEDFKYQFFKFFKIDSPTKLQLSQNNKVYYLKKITGLDNLVESNTSSEFKSFVKYGMDYITISLNEDVTQNIGYLSSLYKTLTWSRINGKQLIPDNLLRFNLKLVLTEIRKYNRVISNFNSKSNTIESDVYGNTKKSPSDSEYKLEIYKDLISKYVYTLYESQMFFPKMPHGDSLDISNPSLIDSYEIKFNFKFSTLKFEKFIFTHDKKQLINLDNKYFNIYELNPQNAVAQSGGYGIEFSEKPIYPIKLDEVLNGNTYTYPESSSDWVDYLNSRTSKSPNTLNDSISQLGKDLTNAVSNELNRKILMKAKLLNKTLDNIRNSIPLIGRMGPPTNIYKQDQFSLKTDLQNAIRGFVGRSVRGFFEQP